MPNKEINPRDSLENLINQVGDMVQKIQTHKGGMEDLTPEFYSKLDRLEQVIGLFEALNEESSKGSQIDLDALKIEALSTKQLSTKDRNLIDRANKIERDVKHLQTLLSTNANPTKQEIKKAKSKLQDRRNKFKRLGGNKGWIPL